MNIRHLSRLTLLCGLLVLIASDPALAQQSKDPCTAAIGEGAACEGVDCALDPNVQLEGPWQRVAVCIHQLRNTWARRGPSAPINIGGQQVPATDAVRNMIYRALTQDAAAAAMASNPDQYVPLSSVINPDLSFKAPVARIALVNDRRLPYSAMSQSGFARVLFGFALLAQRGGYAAAEMDRAAYYQLGQAAVATLIAPLSQGGLATTEPCTAAPQLTCTWFHAVTRKDLSPNQGATLNQNLHAIRDLILIVDTRRRAGWPRDPAYTASIADGLNQLFLSRGHTAAGQAPNMADFLVDRNGTGPSWAYYGFNPSLAPPAGPYFLKEAGRNCRYHDHVLDLMAVILARTANTQIAPEARAKAVACDSPLRRMYLATATNAPMPANAPAVDGAWCPIQRKGDPARTDAFLQSAFAQCPTSR